MGKDTNIEWTDSTWNYIAAFHKQTGRRGWFCTKVNKDCAHCYAEALNLRLGNGLKFIEANLDKIEFQVVEKSLLAPLTWRERQRIFVNSMTDFFHPAIDDFMRRIGFAVMAACPLHTFQILTKQPERMVRFFRENSFNDCFCEAMDWENTKRAGEIFKPAAILRVLDGDGELPKEWPLPNVHLGVTAGHQEAADKFIPLLLKVPAAIRFVSVEPLLGPVDLSDRCPRDHDEDGDCDQHPTGCPKIDWVIVGGESGPKARRCEVEWIENIVEQCVEAGVRVFVKQMGDNFTVYGHPAKLHSPKGKDMDEWLPSVRVREFPAR